MPHHDHFGNPEHFADYLKRLEEPARAEWQKPAEVLRALRLQPADLVADIGAGTGYFALPLAAQVRHVVAVEVEPRLLERLVRHVAETGVINVTPLLALPGDPLLPPLAFDLAVIVDTYHHFPDGPAYLRKLATALRPGGRVANIDFREHKTPREQFLRDAGAAGLHLIEEHQFLPQQYFLVLQQ